MMRATMSVLLPAGKGTTRRIGRSGHPASPVWATAAPANISVASAIDSNRIIHNLPAALALAPETQATFCRPCFDGPGREVKSAAMDAAADSGEIVVEPTC